MKWILTLVIPIRYRNRGNHTQSEWKCMGKESTFEIVRKTLLKTTRLDYAPPEFQGCILERSSRESPAKRNFISISARLNKARFNRCRSLNNTFQFPKDINPFSIVGRGGTGRADK